MLSEVADQFQDLSMSEKESQENASESSSRRKQVAMQGMDVVLDALKEVSAHDTRILLIVFMVNLNEHKIICRLSLGPFCTEKKVTKSV